MDEYLLTTRDNPYNPFTQWDEWLGFDTLKGYNTLSLLARMVITADSFSEKEEDEAYHHAVMDIIASDPLGLYKRVKRDEEIVVS